MIERLLKEYIESSGFNFISKKEAMDKKYEGLVIFDEPLVGYADANDPLFDEYESNYDILQCRFEHPKKWLEGAKTVMSVFFPYTQEVKISNMKKNVYPAPSNEWLHARYEGQTHLNNMSRYLREGMIDAGYECVAVALSDKYIGRFVKDRKSNEDYSGNWSERHAAYVAGLGTFGLSRGLITKRGVAGRFLSLITNMEHEPTPREYSDIYEWCNMCGACIKVCPANAIDKENGKQHVPCHKFLNEVLEKSRPRYGCGKCQVGVPCMDKAPGRKASLPFGY